MEFARDNNSEEIRIAMAEGYAEVGDKAFNTGDLETAKDFYIKEFQIYEELFSEHVTVDVCDRLATSYYKLGYNFGISGTYEKAYVIWSELAEMLPDNKTFARKRDFMKDVLDKIRTMSENSD